MPSSIGELMSVPSSWNRTGPHLHPVTPRLFSQARLQLAQQPHPATHAIIIPWVAGWGCWASANARAYKQGVGVLAGAELAQNAPAFSQEAPQ